MTMEHYRDNKKLRNLTYEHEYSYDSPKSFKYDTYSTFSYFNLNKTMFLGHLSHSGDQLQCVGVRLCPSCVFR